MWSWYHFKARLDCFSQDWNRFVDLLRGHNLNRFPKTALVRCGRHLVVLVGLFKHGRLLLIFWEFNRFVNLLARARFLENLFLLLHVQPVFGHSLRRFLYRLMCLLNRIG
jgi:hypothetical protein